MIVIWWPWREEGRSNHHYLVSSKALTGSEQQLLLQLPVSHIRLRASQAAQTFFLTCTFLSN